MATVDADVVHVSGDVDCNRILPRKPIQLGVLQNGPHLLGGVGVPPASLGSDGDYYFRQDTPGVVNQRIYAKVSGVWGGVI